MMDTFHRASPVEAISETLSKLVFHPMEYVGERMGKFFAGAISAVPFWIQPFLLILLFVFGFLALFGYRIRTPFVSIEPAPRPRIDSPQRVFVQEQAIIERPPAPIVPVTSRDASTSTDDLEDYILQQEQEQRQEERRGSRLLGSPPRSRTDWRYIRDLVIQALSLLYLKTLQLLSKLLRETPSAVVPYDDRVDLIWEHQLVEEPRPILPEQEVIYPQPQLQDQEQRLHVPNKEPLLAFPEQEVIYPQAQEVSPPEEPPHVLPEQEVVCPQRQQAEVGARGAGDGDGYEISKMRNNKA
jgi:hypothetical protein